jgi:predicted metalloendopeptidase
MFNNGSFYILQIFGLGIQHASVTTSWQVEEMMADIRVAFMNLVRQAKWMDEETRNHAFRKLRAMGQMIAYPDFFIDPGYIEERYRGVSTTVSY